MTCRRLSPQDSGTVRWGIATISGAGVHQACGPLLASQRFGGIDADAASGRTQRSEDTDEQHERGRAGEAAGHHADQGLLSRGSQVRALPGAPKQSAARFPVKPHGAFMKCRVLAALMMASSTAIATCATPPYTFVDPTESRPAHKLRLSEQEWQEIQAEFQKHRGDLIAPELSVKSWGRNLESGGLIEVMCVDPTATAGGPVFFFRRDEGHWRILRETSWWGKKPSDAAEARSGGNAPEAEPATLRVRPRARQPSLTLASESVSYGWQATRGLRPERTVAPSGEGGPGAPFSASPARLELPYARRSRGP